MGGRTVKELAYVIEVFHGDGKVCKDKANYEYLIELEAVDRDLLLHSVGI